MAMMLSSHHDHVEASKAAPSLSRTGKSIVTLSAFASNIENSPRPIRRIFHTCAPTRVRSVAPLPNFVNTKFREPRKLRVRLRRAPLQLPQRIPSPIARARLVLVEEKLVEVAVGFRLVGFVVLERCAFAIVRIAF